MDKAKRYLEEALAINPHFSRTDAEIARQTLAEIVRSSVSRSSPCLRRKYAA